jgi:hypothetical protein
LGQRLFNYKDDNSLINQLLTPLEEHEVEGRHHGKSPLFCEPVSVANSWQNFPASPAEKFDRLGKSAYGL